MAEQSKVNKDFYKQKKFWIAIVMALSFAFPQVREVADKVIDTIAIEKSMDQ